MRRELFFFGMSGLWFLMGPDITLAEDQQIDVRGGIFEGRMDTAPHERASRYEEVREKRIDRNPRNTPERQIVDPILDESLGSQTANDTKHALDAVQNINQAIQIRNNRVEKNGSAK